MEIHTTIPLVKFTFCMFLIITIPTNAHAFIGTIIGSAIGSSIGTDSALESHERNKLKSTNFQYNPKNIIVCSNYKSEYDSPPTCTVTKCLKYENGICVDRSWQYTRIKATDIARNKLHMERPVLVDVNVHCFSRRNCSTYLTFKDKEN